LFSKTRFIAAQFDAYFEDGLWLKMAGHANAMASLLASSVRASPHCRLAWEVESNEVFVILPSTLADEWRARGVGFHQWTVPADLIGTMAEDEVLARLVTNFATGEAEVVEFGRMLGS
jgi:threonine aldolase